MGMLSTFLNHGKGFPVDMMMVPTETESIFVCRPPRRCTWRGELHVWRCRSCQSFSNAYDLAMLPRCCSMAATGMACCSAISLRPITKENSRHGYGFPINQKKTIPSSRTLSCINGIDADFWFYGLSGTCVWVDPNMISCMCSFV